LHRHGAEQHVGADSECHEAAAAGSIHVVIGCRAAGKANQLIWIQSGGWPAVGPHQAPHIRQRPATEACRTTPMQPQPSQPATAYAPPPHPHQRAGGAGRRRRRAPSPGAPPAPAAAGSSGEQPPSWAPGRGQGRREGGAVRGKGMPAEHVHCGSGRQDIGRVQLKAGREDNPQIGRASWRERRKM